MIYLITLEVEITIGKILIHEVCENEGHFCKNFTFTFNYKTVLFSPSQQIFIGLNSFPNKRCLCCLFCACGSRLSANDFSHASCVSISNGVLHNNTAVAIILACLFPHYWYVSSGWFKWLLKCGEGVQNHILRYSC